MFNLQNIFRRKQPCWILTECLSETRKKCPAYLDDRGFECWEVDDTLCKGNGPVAPAEKLKICSGCDYYILNIWGFQPTKGHKKLIRLSLQEAMERLAQVSVVQVVEITVDLMRYLSAEKNITLTFKVEESVPHIFGDVDHLKELLVTLISNAIKYTEDNGQIEVEVSDFEKQGVKVTVSDTGIGVKPQEREKIFLSPEIANSKHKEQAVGLAIAKEIVEQHGGRIWVENRSPKGSNFIFTLPKDQRSIERRSDAERRQAERRAEVHVSDEDYESLQEAYEQKDDKRLKQHRRQSERREGDRRFGN